MGLIIGLFILTVVLFIVMLVMLRKRESSYRIAVVYSGKFTGLRIVEYIGTGVSPVAKEYARAFTWREAKAYIDAYRSEWDDMYMEEVEKE